MTFYSHPQRVDALFDTIEATLRSHGLQSQALPAYRQDALRQRPAWKARVEGLVQGALSSGRLNAEDAAGITTALADCMETPSGLVAVGGPIAWTIIVAMFGLVLQLLEPSRAQLMVLVATAAVAGGLWAWNCSWMDPRLNPMITPLARTAFTALVFVMAPLATFSITSGAARFMHQASLRQFEAERAQLLTDSSGLASIRALARDTLGVDVALGGVDDSWAMTTLNVPGASPASMSVNSGYCVLNFEHQGVVRGFPAPPGVSADAWQRGIMAHELGHCADISRDELSPTAGLRLPSLAPQDRARVRDAQGYVQAEETLATKVWRESFGDLFAVGYWRLHDQAEAAALIAGLQAKRAAAASLDPGHATARWIEAAAAAAAPLNDKALVRWADALRAAAPVARP